jgi:cell division protein FtsB
MTTRPRRPAARPVTRAELRRELARILAVVENNAREIAALRTENNLTVRRCAEMQLEIDRLKKGPFIP